jgi:hypothetical protein
MAGQFLLGRRVLMLERRPPRGDRSSMWHLRAALLSVPALPSAAAPWRTSHSARWILSGQRVTENGVGIYLIDPEGYRRGIPGTVNSKLYKHDWVRDDVDVDSIAERPRLSSNAYFASVDHAATVGDSRRAYLVVTPASPWTGCRRST